MNENGPPTPAPALSVIVAVRDAWNDTFRLLMALAQCPSPVARELVVVDDGSGDDTPLALPHLEGPRLHRNDEPMGLVRAANQGAALAHGRYLLFLGNGAAPAAGFLEPLLAAIAADPSVAAVGPALVDADDAPRPADPAAAWAAAAGHRLPKGPGCAALGRDGLLVRAAAFHAAGGFDASYRDRLAEIDLCLRLADAGGRVLHVPAGRLRVNEPVGAGLPATPEDETLLAARWAERFGAPIVPPAERAEAAELGAGPDPALREVATPPFPATLPREPDPRPLATCAVIPDHDGTWEIELRLEGGRRTPGGKVRLRCAEPVRAVAVPFLPEGQSRMVEPGEMLAHLSAGYDLERASAELAARRTAGEPARIAFTAVRTDLLGGGTNNLVRLANWLTDMGAEVGVYSDTPLPTWVQLNARFHHNPVPAERYAAIEEPVVVAYSVLELPRLLRHLDRRGRRVYHLCQGAEEFHYGNEPPPPLLAPNGAFDLLNSLPVGRIVVSPHLVHYFAEKYRQRSVLIPNGVDTDLFRPPAEPRAASRGELTVVVSGSPVHPLKGIAGAKEALALLARRHPRWKLRLVNICGPRFPVPPLSLEDGFLVETRVGLSPPEVRDVLQRADAYLNASWYEGFGLPTLEAMACGLPVVQSDNHGLTGVVENGRDCLEVPVADPEAAAAALERILLDPSLRGQLAAEGRRTALRHPLARQREAVAAAFSAISGVRLEPPAAPVVEAGAERPRFSVLVPTYNQARFLPAALDSLLAQTERDWEALVVDDGSTDETPEVMGRYAARDRRVRCFHRENGGVAAALDTGLAQARAEWICWLSSDDLFLPEKLSLHRQVAEADPGVRFMHTNFRVLRDQTGQVLPSGLAVEGFIPPVPMQVLRFLQVNYVNGISVAVHRAVFDRVGAFDEEYRYGQDCDLWLRASARYRLRFIDAATCVTRLHPAQGTALFTEAGIYDSARAAVAFLGRHPFPDLFPALDLGQPGQALQALSASLSIALQPESFLARCGLSSVLLDRVKEWVTGLPERLRFVVQSQLEVAMEHQARPEARAVLRDLASAPPGFRFRPVNPFALFERHLARLERRGDAREHEALARYLALFGQGRAGGPMARAS